MGLIPIAAGLLGLADLVLAVVYFFVPAGSLPSFLPGFEPGGADIHVRHAIFSLVGGIVLLGIAWILRDPGRGADKA